jgi:predicted AlkP superfamily pyrophosphatase or phosphodiesterase
MMNFFSKRLYFLSVIFLFPLLGESYPIQINREKVNQTEIVSDSLKTEYVFVLVIDGPRMSETFDDTSFQYIPNLARIIAPQGVLVKNFRNNGPTYTNAGHTAITTGVYQKINNGGLELPKNPSMFQYFLKDKNYDSTEAWVIASKGKLDILANTKDKSWKDKFTPAAYCGTNGSGFGYTSDKYTWRDAQVILNQYHPKLTLMNLLEVDSKGHQADWEGYLQGIRNTDKIAMELWDFIQNDSIYKDKTTLFITNDHGRHLEGKKNGFINHGCNCEGCRSIYLIALGPDFKSNTVLQDEYEQLDISKTIAHMLNFDYPISEGEVMYNLFK